MRSLSLSALAALVCASFVTNSTASAGEHDASSGAAVVREMNSARQNPALYAGYIEELRTHMADGCIVLPGHTRIRTKEGTAALDEAIRFLHSAQPLAPLTLSRGMSRASADHCADQANGEMGHNGRDGSSPGSRISRYGVWSAAWGENIAYGKSNARDVVMALIIDDGLPGRKHRKNIFNSSYNFAGAAFGSHARFRTICSMDFAGGFVERGESETLIARN